MFGKDEIRTDANLQQRQEDADKSVAYDDIQKRVPPTVGMNQCEEATTQRASKKRRAKIPGAPGAAIRQPHPGECTRQKRGRSEEAEKNG
ncbi:hypothetical protein [Terriglobus roseus]|uniref:hypothetical protein n=1 Tax=Terriglobus roseus TaxID=392734 RepID=UPI001114948A|nr:hypothetical protein [Terriglobus roseus]